ncbi:MAG: hypothetical protein E5X83_30615 [Mesorhizobium sp.]|nr:hypothetical protein [Mesorhizobium ciceri]RWL19879.1 MAG: hypothetical protein EOR57_11865 [Mesorhizobium sp.]RWM65569.1 MAG: hypothetical protein EOR82_30680 [Mesorhizobium sp.]TIO21225.1 MAG: hypothetical protein E5X83_30615 [Mesorhizobium sp.]TIQ36351.1 MAG: hypothetical protein E5X61_19905 [Mesorhizobium sp.]
MAQTTPLELADPDNVDRPASQTQGLEPLWSLQRLNGSADVGNVRILLVPLSETEHESSTRYSPLKPTTGWQKSDHLIRHSRDRV